MTPTQRTAALRLADVLDLCPMGAVDHEVSALLRELAAPVNQSLTTEPDCYGYASRLATGIWEKHYKADSPQWKPLDDTLGVLTQIDNMASGLTRKAEPVQEPVAWFLGEPGNYREVEHWAEGAFPVYAAPPQRQPLSDEQIDRLDTQAIHGGPDSQYAFRFARAIEAAHGIGARETS